MDSHITPLLGSFVLYAPGTFGRAGEDWHRLSDCATRLLGSAPFAYAWTVGTSGQRGVPSRKLTASHGDALAAAVAMEHAAHVYIADVTRRDAERSESQTFVSVDYNRRMVYEMNAPAQLLPCEVRITDALGLQWPHREQCAALLELIDIVDAEYACFFVGDDQTRAMSELSSYPVLPYDMKHEPPWAEEMRRIAQARRDFGVKVRGAYWANVFSSAVMEAVGGIDVLRPTGAARVDPLTRGRVYVQLTERAEDAGTPVGIERLRLLDAVLAPVHA